MGGASFLVVANSEAGYRETGVSKQSIPSFVYKFNSTTNQFQIFQSINTNGANDWEFFEIAGSSFLVVANTINGTSSTRYNIPSTIYKFNSVSSRFEVFRSILTNGAVDWEYFQMNGSSFLVVANSYTAIGNIGNVPSVIYKIQRVCL
jgi:uncharacterized protein with LGFP repeats